MKCAQSLASIYKEYLGFSVQSGCQERERNFAVKTSIDVRFCFAI